MKAPNSKIQAPKKLQTPRSKLQRSTKHQDPGTREPQEIIFQIFLMFDVSLEPGVWILELLRGLLHLDKRDPIFALGFASEEAAIGFSEQFAFVFGILRK